MIDNFTEKIIRNDQLEHKSTAVAEKIISTILLFITALIVCVNIFNASMKGDGWWLPKFAWSGTIVVGLSSFAIFMIIMYIVPIGKRWIFALALLGIIILFQFL
jgi:hypothetical protein